MISLPENDLGVLILGILVAMVLINIYKYYGSKRKEITSRMNINNFNSSMLVITEMMDDILDSQMSVDLIQSYKKSSGGKLTEIQVQKLVSIVSSRIEKELSNDMLKSIKANTPSVASIIDIKVRAAVYRIENGRRNPY